MSFNHWFIPNLIKSLHVIPSWAKCIDHPSKSPSKGNPNSKDVGLAMQKQFLMMFKLKKEG